MNNYTENALDLISQGSTLMAQSQYEKALEKFSEAQKDSPKYIECYINLGNAYSCLEKYEDAIDSFKKALMLDDKNCTAIFGIGNVLYMQGETLEALKYYNRADEIGDLTSDMYEVVAGIFMDSNDHIQALRFLNKAIAKDPLNGELYLEKASIFVEDQRADEALETLHELNKILPDAYEAYDMLSEIYSIKGDYANAIAIIEKGVARFPEDENIQYLKLKVLINFEKDAEAAELVSKIKSTGKYELRKEDFAQLEAQIYLRAGDMNKAAQCLEDATGGVYTNQQLCFVLVNIYFKLQNFEKVIEITEKVMEEDSSLFYTASAKFYHAQAKFLGKYSDAEAELRTITKEFRRITVNEPSFIEGYTYRLLTHKALKEFDEALSLADYLGNMFPDRIDGHLFKYAIYKDMNDEEKAEQEKQEILNIDPDYIL